MINVRKQLSACFLSMPLLFGSLGAFAQNPGAVVQPIVPHEQRDTAEVKPQEDSATAFVTQNLTLSQTTIRTANDQIDFGSEPVAAFMPTTMVCPATHAAGCTIKVEVTARTADVPVGNAVDYELVINGSGPPVDPGEFLPTTASTVNALGAMQSAQWAKRAIPAGASEVVNVSFVLNGSTTGTPAAAVERIETVQLYLNQ